MFCGVFASMKINFEERFKSYAKIHCVKDQGSCLLGTSDSKRGITVGNPMDSCPTDDFTLVWGDEEADGMAKEGCLRMDSVRNRPHIFFHKTP